MQPGDSRFTTDVERTAGPPVVEDAGAADSNLGTRGTARSFEGGGRAARGEGLSFILSFIHPLFFLPYFLFPLFFPSSDTFSE